MPLMESLPHYVCISVKCLKNDSISIIIAFRHLSLLDKSPPKLIIYIYMQVIRVLYILYIYLSIICKTETPMNFRHRCIPTCHPYIDPSYSYVM